MGCLEKNRFFFFLLYTMKVNRIQRTSAHTKCNYLEKEKTEIFLKLSSFVFNSRKERHTVLEITFLGEVSL